MGCYFRGEGAGGGEMGGVGCISHGIKLVFLHFFLLARFLRCIFLCIFVVEFM